MTQTPGRPIVLVVDDEKAVADTYAMRIESQYDTRVAYGGEVALHLIDDSVDAVLLDRRMPDIHGDEVLESIRERGYDCAVIMLTAVDPDLNIIEMDFDDYLCKPVLGEELLETLDQHIETKSTDQYRLDEYLSIIAKLDVLQEKCSTAELENSEQYQQLRQRATILEPQLREELDDFEGMVDTYRSINRES